MNGRRGFTLVELMIAVAILGVLAGVGGPYILGNLPTYRVNGAARQLVSDFRLAKSLAVEKGRKVFVLFHEPSSGQYTVTLDDGDGVPSGGDTPVKVVELEASYPHLAWSTSDPNAPASAPPGDGVSFPDDVARFLPEGTSVLGSVYLMPAKDVGTPRWDRERKVTVAIQTARARAYRRTASGWE